MIFSAVTNITLVVDEITSSVAKITVVVTDITFSLTHINLLVTKMKKHIHPCHGCSLDKFN